MVYFVFMYKYYTNNYLRDCDILRSPATGEKYSFNEYFFSYFNLRNNVRQK